MLKMKGEKDPSKKVYRKKQPEMLFPVYKHVHWCFLNRHQAVDVYSFTFIFTV